jgi:hypothetical protein
MISSDDTGRLVLGAASQLDGVDPDNFVIYLTELHRVDSKALLLMGPPPYPQVNDITPLVVYREIELDLLHARTGRSSKLFALYDPALASGIARRRRAVALATPHLGDAVPPIVLVGGTRVGGNPATQVLEHAGGAWIVQTGVFSPCDPSEDVQDRSCGGTILHIDLDDRNCPVVPRFLDFAGL